MKVVLRLVCCTVLINSFMSASTQQVTYPYPVQKMILAMDNTKAAMAYMDVSPSGPSTGKTIVLLHGKNFNGYYWKGVIGSLTKAGFRVIIPDQVGWGRSDKPDINYSFHLLARNTATLLDSLGLSKVSLIGHSMGGMLAARFAIMFPARLEKLVLENPIGLEDYKRFVPYRSTEELTRSEKNATLESYKKYQQSYYPAWKPEYEQYVKAQAEILTDPDFGNIAAVNAVTYQMIYEQPVCYEWDQILMPTLLVIGQEDRTVVGKDQLTDEQKKIYGQYPSLGKKTSKQIPNSVLAGLKGIGHIPHIQDLSLFMQHVLAFLK